METITTTELPAIDQQQEVAPTTSVKNFWERLDDVFTQNTELREKMEELVEQFPDQQRINQFYNSSIFQPERLVLNSKDKFLNLSAFQNALEPDTPLINQTFNTFRIKLKKSLINVKSIQLLSAILPTAYQSIPFNENQFLCYKLRCILDSSTGAWNGATNYVRFDIVTDAGNYYYLDKDYNAFIGAWNQNISYVVQDIVTIGGNYYYCNYPNINVNPLDQQPISGTSNLIWTQVSSPFLVSPANNSFFWTLIGPTGGFLDLFPNFLDIKLANIKYLKFLNNPPFVPEASQPINQQQRAFNRLFTANNAPTAYDDLVNNLNLAISVGTTTNMVGELNFYYSETFSRIQVEIATLDPNHPIFYLPLGSLDYNIQQYEPDPNILYQPMNVRLGFTWNGLIPGYNQGTWAVGYNAFNDNVVACLQQYIFPNFLDFQPFQTYLTFNSYPDLCYSSSVLAYCDFTQGSTQDSAGDGNLLSVIPVNTGQLGIAYYQNNFTNPLTKIPQYITEINIRLITDTGFPYYVPNEATVLLELAINYK
jgi:hypothetical protein